MTNIQAEFDSLRTAQEPLVSVIMPARNEEPYIATAIESILRQSYRRFELVIIDDGSTDRTLDVIRRFGDARINVYQKQSDQAAGAPASRNLGALLANGGLIAYQDADDVSHPARLERQVAEFQRGEAPRIVGTWIEYRLGMSSRVLQLPAAHQEIVKGFKRWHHRATMVSGTMLFPRFLALRVPGRPRFRYFGDWDQLCRLHELGGVEFRNVGEPLYVYNIRPKGSKNQADWASYNVFERACHARRDCGLEEWESKQEFEEYLGRSPLQFLRWRSLQFLLRMKAECELWRMRRWKGSGDRFSPTWG